MRSLSVDDRGGAMDRFLIGQKRRGRQAQPRGLFLGLASERRVVSASGWLQDPIRDWVGAATWSIRNT